MNYKLLFPTYRNRYRFVKESLQKNVPEGGFQQALNLGSGEGDYDPMIAEYTQALTSCDLNRADVAFAQASNAHLTKVTYQVENALALSFPDNHFDLIISVEVIEHVGQPEQMMKEIERVLRPGGTLIMTFPREGFPWTYDPINRIRLANGKEKISQGAYAFGHDYLINDDAYNQWITNLSFSKIERRRLSGYLVGLLEMYWTGIVQRLFKENNSNVDQDKAKKGIKLRPSTKDPLLAIVTDALLAVDRFLFKNAKSSIGLGYILQKKK
jgi:SAM-dependent methyltransferase